jgi:hypothetical protein
MNLSAQWLLSHSEHDSPENWLQRQRRSEIGFELDQIPQLDELCLALASVRGGVGERPSQIFLRHYAKEHLLPASTQDGLD